MNPRQMAVTKSCKKISKIMEYTDIHIHHWASQNRNQPVYHNIMVHCICSGEGNGTPLQYSCLENPMDGGGWWAAVHGVARSRTQLSDFTFTFHSHALEKAMATHSSTLAWKIPWMEEPGRLQSMGSLRVGHDWVTWLSLFTFIHWRRKWQPTPVFLPGESQGWGSLVGCHLWSRTEWNMTEAT